MSEPEQQAAPAAPAQTGGSQQQTRPGERAREQAGTRERAGLGIAAGAAAAGLGALLLGGLQGATGPAGLELGYWSLAIGLLVGAVLGKVGGHGRAVAVWGVPLALAGVALAQLLAAALQVGPADAVLWHLGPAVDYWQGHVLGRNDITFYTVAGLEGYLVAERVAR